MQTWGEHACHELEMSILTSESWMLAAHCAQPWGLSPTLEMAPFTFRKVLRRRRLSLSLLLLSDVCMYVYVGR